MNRNFLKEAIADAKTVKESAIANAKIALEEAFAPRIQSMLSAKLEEMDKEEMDEEMDDKVEEAKKDDSDKKFLFIFPCFFCGIRLFGIVIRINNY